MNIYVLSRVKQFDNTVVSLRKLFTVMIFGTLLVVFNLSCTSTAYSGPPVSRELPSDASKTTIAELESMLGTEMEIPSYLPYGYKIQEIYYLPSSSGNPKIYFLISDQPIKWEGNHYECQVVYEIGWNEFGAGLKMDWAKYIKSIDGRLENRDEKYILWWESAGSYGPKRSTSRLYASEEFPKNELIKIAASTFSSESS